MSTPRYVALTIAAAAAVTAALVAYSGAHRPPRDLALRPLGLTVPRYAEPAPVGDVDGDGRGDVALIDDNSRDGRA